MTTRVRNLPARSGALNNTRKRQNRYSQDKGGLVIEATTISAVNSTNSFDDSGSGLPTFVAGQLIEAIGLVNNSRVWRVVSSTAASVVVDGGTITNESAGSTVILRSV